MLIIAPIHSTVGPYKTKKRRLTFSSQQAVHSSRKPEILNFPISPTDLSGYLKCGHSSLSENVVLIHIAEHWQYLNWEEFVALIRFTIPVGFAAA